MIKKMYKKTYSIIWSYDNFTFYYEQNSTQHNDLKSCFNEYLREVEINRDLMKSSIQEPKCYFRIREEIETDDEILVADYKVVHHRNGRYTLKRTEDII